MKGKYGEVKNDDDDGQTKTEKLAFFLLCPQVYRCDKKLNECFLSLSLPSLVLRRRRGSENKNETQTNTQIER